MAELQSAVPPASRHYLYPITSPQWWTHLNTYIKSVAPFLVVLLSVVLLSIPREDEDKMAGWAKAMLNSAVDPKGTDEANAEFTEYVSP